MESAQGNWMRLFILLLLPGIVFANHHRGHAIGFTYNVDLHNAELIKRFDKYVSAVDDAGCALSNTDLQSIEVIYRYSGFIADNMVLVRRLLENDGSLDDARRIVTRPNGDPPNSSDTLMEGLVNRSRMLMPSCPEANVWLAQSQQRLALMWTNIDRVNWHIQDAVREEVYLDQSFICSGPGNHC